MAKNRSSEELQAIVMTASVLQSMKNVTKEILKAGKGETDPVKRIGLLTETAGKNCRYKTKCNS